MNKWMMGGCSAFAGSAGMFVRDGRVWVAVIELALVFVICVDQICYEMHRGASK